MTFIAANQAESLLTSTRRQLLTTAGSGVGLAALHALLAQSSRAADTGSADGSSSMEALPGFPQFPPKAKNIIYLFQNGGPTHVDLFDYKPRLAELHGQPVPTALLVASDSAP